MKFSIYLNRRVFVKTTSRKLLGDGGGGGGGGRWGGCGGGGLKPVLLARNLTLNSDAAPFTNICSVRSGVFCLICETAQ